MRNQMSTIKATEDTPIPMSFGLDSLTSPKVVSDFQWLPRFAAIAAFAMYENLRTVGREAHDARIDFPSTVIEPLRGDSCGKVFVNFAAREARACNPNRLTIVNSLFSSVIHPRFRLTETKHNAVTNKNVPPKR